MATYKFGNMPISQEQFGNLSQIGQLGKMGLLNKGSAQTAIVKALLDNKPSIYSQNFGGVGDTQQPSPVQQLVSQFLKPQSTNTPPIDTSTQTSNEPQPQEQGSFGFGTAPGQLFGTGGLAANLTQPFRQGIINPIAQAGQSIVKGGLNTQQEANPQVNVLQQQAQQAFVQGDQARGHQLIQQARDLLQPALQTSGAANPMNIVQNQTPFAVSQQEADNYNSNPVLGGIKSAAGIASFAVPVAGAPTLAGKIALGGLAGSAFGFGTSAPGQEAQNTLSGGVGGALTAGVLGKLFPGVAGEAGQADNLFAKATMTDEAGHVTFNPSNLSNVEQNQLDALTSKYVKSGVLPDIKSVANIPDNYYNSLAKLEDIRLQNGLGFSSQDMSQVAKIAGSNIQQELANTTLNVAKNDFTSQVLENANQYIKNNPVLGKYVNAETQGLVKPYLTDGVLDTSGAFKLKQATDKLVSPLLDALNGSDQQAALAAETRLSNPEIIAKVAANQTARNVLTTANPALQDSLAQYAILAKNTGTIGKAFLSDINPSLGNSNVNSFSRFSLPGKAISAVRQGYQTGLANSVDNNTIAGNLAKGASNISSLLGKGTSAINNLPNTGVGGGAITSILGGQAGITGSAPQPPQPPQQLQDNNSQGLPAKLDERPVVDQSNPKAQQIAVQLLNQGYTTAEIKTAFQLNPTLQQYGNPFPQQMTTAQKLKVQQAAQTYNQVNDLINQVKQNASQFGSIGGGSVGKALSGSNAGNRTALFAKIKAIPAAYKTVVGSKDITSLVDPQQDSNTIISNLKSIQSDIYDAYQARIDAASNNPSLTIGQ